MASTPNDAQSGSLACTDSRLPMRPAKGAGPFPSFEGSVASTTQRFRHMWVIRFRAAIVEVEAVRILSKSWLRPKSEVRCRAEVCSVHPVRCGANTNLNGTLP